MTAEPREIRVDVGDRIGAVSALIDRPRDARALFVLAHGAGAGMRHSFMESISAGLVAAGMATFRYQFPYMEQALSAQRGGAERRSDGQGRRAPNPPAVLAATVRAAASAAAKAAPDLPMIAGGKSLGGRMTSTAAAHRPLAGVRGLVFFGFPLHAPGKPGRERAAHLRDVGIPMLFLQGTRDDLADLDLLRPVLNELGERAQLHVVEGGDHSFHVLKRSGRTDAEVHRELVARVARWCDSLA